jgi:hypothetical protein
MKGAYQPSIALQGEQMLRTTFAMLRRAFPCCEPSSLQHSTNDVASVLRTCSEHVANEVTCNIQTSGVFLPPPRMLRLCCDHVATCVACNIQHQEPSLPSSLTQHPTLHVCNIETQHPQHLLNHSETLRCICRNMLE